MFGGYSLVAICLLGVIPTLCLAAAIYTEQIQVKREDAETTRRLAFPDHRPSVRWAWNLKRHQYRCVQHKNPVCTDCGPFLEYLAEAHSWSSENCEICGLPPLPLKPRPSRPPRPNPVESVGRAEGRRILTRPVLR